MRVGGAPSTGREDWDLNLDHAHWLAHGGCRRYREKVVLLLHDGIRLLGGLNEVKLYNRPAGNNDTMLCSFGVGLSKHAFCAKPLVH